MRISDWSSDVCSSDLRRVGDQPLLLAPAIEAIEAGDGPVPACRRYPVPSLIAASRPMIAVDIVAGRPPYRLATGVEKAKPNHDIKGVGAKRMTRPDPSPRQIETRKKQQEPK